MIWAEYKSKFEPTKDTPCLALMGEPWCVFCEDCVDNWQRYNGTTLNTVCFSVGGDIRFWDCGYLESQKTLNTMQGLTALEVHPYADVLAWWVKIHCYRLEYICGWCKHDGYIDGSAQDRSNSSALAMELLHSCTEPSILTLNMLNCFKDYKRYIHILNHILDLVGPN